MRLLCPSYRLVLALLLVCSAGAQVIKFESGGLNYQTLTKNGVTIMFAFLPTHVRKFSIVQVAVSNGSPAPYKIRPEDFYFELNDGAVIKAVPASRVIRKLIRRASGNDVIKLVTTYEIGLYGMGRIRASNGYEKRRRAALAVVSSKKLKAAAAASAIAFVATTLKPGASTDGAIFYPDSANDPGPVTLTVRTAGTVFRFRPAVSPFSK